MFTGNLVLPFRKLSDIRLLYNVNETFPLLRILFADNKLV